MSESEINADETYFVRQGQPERIFDQFERAPEADPDTCSGFIARGNFRYQKGDPDCIADFRAAFVRDSESAAIEIVRQLEDDIREDIADVLVTCQKRLRANSDDLTARIRLGLALLILCQDSDAFRELRQVFLQNADWRPFLRLLVKEAKRRSSSLFAQALWTT
jgi:hypothetical protein